MQLNVIQERNHLPYKCIGVVMLARSPPVWLIVWFEPRLGQTKDYKHGIYWFSSKKYNNKEKGQRMDGSKSG